MPFVRRNDDFFAEITRNSSHKRGCDPNHFRSDISNSSQLLGINEEIYGLVDSSLLVLWLHIPLISEDVSQSTVSPTLPIKWPLIDISLAGGVFAYASSDFVYHLFGQSSLVRASGRADTQMAQVSASVTRMAVNTGVTLVFGSSVSFRCDSGAIEVQPISVEPSGAEWGRVESSGTLIAFQITTQSH